MNKNEIATKILIELMLDMGVSYDEKVEMEKKFLARVEKAITPAVDAGWQPTDEEISTITSGMEEDAAAAAKAIPANAGKKLAKLLDTIFES